MLKNPCLVLILLFSLVACGGGSSSGPILGPQPDPGPLFLNRGLNGTTVVALAETDGRLFGGTDQGVYRYEEDDRWTRTTPETWSVRSLEGLRANQLIASITVDLDQHLLVESRDGGTSWTILEHNFGGPAGQGPREPAQRLRFDPDSGALFATGYGVLAQSLDSGRNWTILNGAWGIVGTGLGALSFTQGLKDFWYGGQGALEDPVLLRYSPESNETVDLSAAVEDLLPRPSTIENVVFYPTSEDTVFALGEGGVIRSMDYGSSWEASLVNYTSRFYFDLIIDEQTGVTYTGGWSKNFTDPQRLVLEVSTDSGLTWETHQDTDAELRGGIWSMRLLTLDNRRRLFLGLQGGGVYEVNLEALD